MHTVLSIAFIIMVIAMFALYNNMPMKTLKVNSRETHSYRVISVHDDHIIVDSDDIVNDRIDLNQEGQRLLGKNVPLVPGVYVCWSFDEVDTKVGLLFDSRKNDDGTRTVLIVRPGSIFELGRMNMTQVESLDSIEQGGASYIAYLFLQT